MAIFFFPIQSDFATILSIAKKYGYAIYKLEDKMSLINTFAGLLILKEKLFLKFVSLSSVNIFPQTWKSCYFKLEILFKTFDSEE
jgi:hypothetical protein